MPNRPRFEKSKTLRHFVGDAIVVHFEKKCFCYLALFWPAAGHRYSKTKGPVTRLTERKTERSGTSDTDAFFFIWPVCKNKRRENLTKK